MFKKFAASMAGVALAVALPTGAAFAAGSQTADAPDLTATSNTAVTTATGGSNGAAATATTSGTSANSYATSPQTGAINLYTVGVATIVLAAGAGVSTYALRKKISSK